MALDTKELIRRALEDAISWEQELMDACRGRDDEGYRLAKELRDGYRKILKRRYPPRPDPLAGTKLVGLDELRKLAAKR